MPEHETSPTSVEEFIARWKGSQASERGNSVSFLNELCALLGVPAPNPATKDPARDDYVYERAVRLALNAQASAVTAAELARSFGPRTSPARVRAVEELLRTLASLGQAREVSPGRFAK